MILNLLTGIEAPSLLEQQIAALLWLEGSSKQELDKLFEHMEPPAPANIGALLAAIDKLPPAIIRETCVSQIYDMQG